MISFEVGLRTKNAEKFSTKFYKKNAPIFSSEKKERETKH
jgi:hypothetical protein